MRPEYGLGFWQCKLRYQTQEELLGVAREYRARSLPLDLIVIDFFYWTGQTLVCSLSCYSSVWSYGEEVYAICKKYMFMREETRDYIQAPMRQAHEKGTPVVRPLLYTFLEDRTCWEVEVEYMFGDRYLCCPVLAPGLRRRDFYLPKGCRWKTWDARQDYEGGKVIEAEFPLDMMPVFERQ